MFGLIYFRGGESHRRRESFSVDDWPIRDEIGRDAYYQEGAFLFENTNSQALFYKI